MLFAAVFSIGIVSAIVFMWERTKRGGVRALLLKAFTSVMFVACGAVGAVEAAGSGSSHFALMVLMGLVFGLMGDIWLDLKWVYQQDNDTYTFAGFGSFIIGHLMFITAVISNYANNSSFIYIAVPALISLVAAIGMLLLEKPMKMNYGRFKPITVFYTFIVSFMAFLCGGLALMNNFEIASLNMMFAGGIFFAISDLILSGTYFGQGKRRPIDIITNHGTYYAAQFLIASSLIFLK